ncbi:MAG: hypothetical protein BJ554DRAFT_6086, partial [Olpidium bornovanus]
MSQGEPEKTNAAVLPDARSEPTGFSEKSCISRFCLRADNLPSGLLSTPTAHFVISRAVGTSGDAFHPVFQSQAAAKSTSPVWPPVELPLLTLCNGNLDISLRVEIWNKHKLIGQAVRTGREFQSGLVVPLASLPASGRKCGTLQVVEWDVVKIPTFLEYIRGGANILMTVAIDWTASNGDPRTPESLHYNCPGRYNEYQQAILSVGSILEEYDSDKMLPVRLCCGLAFPDLRCRLVYFGRETELRFHYFFLASVHLSCFPAKFLCQLSLSPSGRRSEIDLAARLARSEPYRRCARSVLDRPEQRRSLRAHELQPGHQRSSGAGQAIAGREPVQGNGGLLYSPNADGWRYHGH